MDNNEMATDLATIDQTNLPTLTPKQMAFVQGLASGLDDNKAYSHAYDTSNWAMNSIYAQASKMRTHPKIILWLDALKQNGHVAALCTVEAHLGELEKIKSKAIAKDQLSVAARCEELKGKVNGHYVERREIRHEMGQSYLRAFDAISARASVGVTKGDDAKVIEHEPAG